MSRQDFATTVQRNINSISKATSGGQISEGEKSELIKMGMLLVVGIAAVYGIKRLVKAIQNSSDSRALDDTTPVKRSNLTISESQAQTYAQQLFVAMDGVGTDEDTIERIMMDKIKTVDDMNLVIKCFGLKDYGTTGTPYWGSVTPMNLFGWFYKECSGSLYQKILDKANSLGVQVA